MRGKLQGAEALGFARATSFLAVLGLAVLIALVTLWSRRASDQPAAEPASLPADAKGARPSQRGGAPVLGYRVVASFPHNPKSYTQGLEFRDGLLYEGTGQYGRSSLRKVDLNTGSALNFLMLPSEYFGEGVTVLDNRIYQLTWKAKTAFLYDRETLRRVGQFTYESEGWGLANDGARLVMSDGTDRLTFRDPDTFAEIGHVMVRDADGPVTLLNELECIDGAIYANVWKSDYIARIDPADGRVTAWIDLAGLLESTGESTAQAEVLNGIAYDGEGKRLFVTGKYWPRIFQIELVDPPQ